MHPGMSKSKRAPAAAPATNGVRALIQAWEDAEAFSIEAREAAAQAKQAALDAALPENLRPAEAEDIKIGALIWHPERVPAWVVVELLGPAGCRTASIIGRDGSRRGLDGAFVEIDE